jgi:site-specific DNA recombinase
VEVSSQQANRKAMEVNYYYYHCIKGCDERIKAEEANDALIKKSCALCSEQWFCSTDGVYCKNAKNPSSEKEIYQKSILRDIEKYNQRIKSIQEQLSDKEISSKDYKGNENKKALKIQSFPIWCPGLDSNQA